MRLGIVYTLAPCTRVQLAQTILYLHRSSDLCAKLAINGRRYMENHLDHRAILSAFRNPLAATAYADQFDVLCSQHALSHTYLAQLNNLGSS
jgi:hypothetical protein